MFTGIIEDLGIVKGIQKKQDYRLAVESAILNNQKPGQSIAVNGACLTISDSKNNLASFDIMPETIKKSNLGNLKVNEKVNLERALKIGDRLSGHFVSGHIDCVGRVIEKGKRQENYYLKVQFPKEDARFIVEKGSIALDGVSLTITEIGINNFTVCLIPHTLENTNLEFKKVDDKLNIEFDLVGKYIQKERFSLRPNPETREPSPITEDFLRRHGY